MKVDFSRYYECLNPAFHPLVEDTNRFQIIKGGAGCVHPNTRIHTEKGLIRISDITRPTKVLSWNQKTRKFQLSLSGGSFPKGRDFLYRVSTKCGEFLSSGHHRILLSSGEYQRVDTLRSGDEINQVHFSQHQTNSGFSKNLFDVDVQNYSQKAVSLLSRYADEVRQYDPQPHEVGDYALFSSPSGSDVQESDRSCLTSRENHVGKSHLRTHPCLYDAHTCKKHSYARAPYSAPSSVNRISTSSSGYTLDLHQGFQLSQKTISHHHKVEQFVESEPTQQVFSVDSFKLPFTNKFDVLSGTTPVLSIKKVGFSEYWCMQVLDTNNYICENGIVHHNSGKSHFIAQDEIYKQIFFPGTNLLVIRQTAKSNRTSTFPLMKQVIESFGVSSLFHIRESDMTIRCIHNGNEIRFFGLDDVEKLKSVTFTTGPLTRIWIEEANETKETDFNQINLRLRGQAKVQFQIRLSFNPISANHWLKARFFDMPDERGRTTLHHSTYWHNEYIDPDYKEELERLKDIDKVFYSVYCLGEWGVFGNIVFTNWEARKCEYKEEDFDEIFTGMDFGFNHPSAIEKIGIKDGALWSFDELYVREKTNIELIEMKDNPLRKGELCTADSAEPARIKEWRQHEYNVEGAIKGKDSVSRGIDFIKSCKWYIDPEKCPGLLAEVGSFSYKEDKFGNKTDEPIAFKDDGIAAVRYALEQKALSSKGVFFA